MKINRLGLRLVGTSDRASRKAMQHKPMYATRGAFDKGEVDQKASSAKRSHTFKQAAFRRLPIHHTVGGNDHVRRVINTTGSLRRKQE